MNDKSQVYCGKPYTNENKKETARLLKKLRLRRKDEKGKSYSHETLVKKLEENYGPGVISDKTLLLYEIVDEDHDKFNVGKGMKIDTLVMLANFYDVSADRLLGIEKHKINTINELGLEIGLDEESINKLKIIAGDVNYRDVTATINNIIHTIDISASYKNDGKTLIESNREIINVKRRNYISPLFLETLTKYLYFTSETQYINILRNDFSDEWLDRWLDEFGQFDFSEEEVSNIFLLELQKMIVDSRKNYKFLRVEKSNRTKKFFNKAKRKKKKEQEKKAKEKEQKEIEGNKNV